MDFGAGRISDIGPPSTPRFMTSADNANGKKAIAIMPKAVKPPAIEGKLFFISDSRSSAVRNRDARGAAVNRRRQSVLDARPGENVVCLLFQCRRVIGLSSGCYRLGTWRRFAQACRHS